MTRRTIAAVVIVIVIVVLRGRSSPSGVGSRLPTTYRCRAGQLLKIVNVGI